MQRIYLARPGAQKEGPFTIEQINHDLATKRISDTDFWAWHEGLPAWTPLYSVPGVSAKAWVVAVPEAKPQRATVKASPASQNGETKPESSTPRTETAPATVSEAASEGLRAKAKAAVVAKLEPEEFKVRAASAPVVQPEPRPIRVEAFHPALAKPQSEELKEKAHAKPVPLPEATSISAIEAAPSPEPKAETPQAAQPEAPLETTTQTVEALPDCQQLFATSSMSSGKPFAALEQIFVFTTGEGPSAVKSRVTIAMLFEAVGQRFDDIRAKVPVDVIAGTAEVVLEAFRAGAIPGSAWRAMSKIKPSVAQQAQEGAYHLCVRTFPLESKDLVALFLLYNKQKL